MTDFQTDRETILRDVQADISQTFSKAFDDVKSEVDELVDSLDISGVARKLEGFGRDRPVALALAALTVGLAAGLLIKNSNRAV